MPTPDTDAPTTLDPHAINQAATFYPADPTEPGTLPCIELAGIQIYAYVTAGGMVRVALHTDTPEVDPRIQRAARTVALEVTINGTTVVHDGDEAAGTEDDPPDPYRWTDHHNDLDGWCPFSHVSDPTTQASSDDQRCPAGCPSSSIEPTPHAG